MDENILKDLDIAISNVRELECNKLYWVFLSDATPEDVYNTANALNDINPNIKFIVSSDRFKVAELKDGKEYSVLIDGGMPEDVEDVQAVLDTFSDAKFNVSTNTYVAKSLTDFTNFDNCE